jgi:hypothetical protein
MVVFGRGRSARCNLQLQNGISVIPDVAPSGLEPTLHPLPPNCLLIPTFSPPRKRRVAPKERKGKEGGKKWNDWKELCVRRATRERLGWIGLDRTG